MIALKIKRGFKKMKIANAYCRDKTRKLPKNIAWLTFPKRIKNKKNN